MTSSPEHRFTCPKCMAVFPDLSQIKAELRAKFAALCRSRRSVSAIAEMRSAFGFGLAEAKIIATHITKSRATCLRCQHVLSEGSETQCSNCSALNLDW